MATPEAPAAGAHAGAARSRCSFCLARQKASRLRTRVRASWAAVPVPVRPEPSIAPAQHWESTAVYVPVVVVITFGYEGKHGIGTETDGANTVVLMGARLYNPATGRFLQVDPVFGGNANAYDYVWQDPLNKSDLAGLSAKAAIGTFKGLCRLSNGRLYCRAGGSRSAEVPTTPPCGTTTTTTPATTTAPRSTPTTAPDYPETPTSTYEDAALAADWIAVGGALGTAGLGEAGIACLSEAESGEGVVASIVTVTGAGLIVLSIATGAGTVLVVGYLMATIASGDPGGYP